MDRLDVATALAIRERLGARDLARSSAVCREFNALANDDTLWRGLSSRETHALVGADELSASSISRHDAGSVAKRLYLCNRGWVDGEIRRDGSCFTRDDAFVEAAFADHPGERSRSRIDENADRPFALRAVHSTGAVIDRPDEAGAGAGASASATRVDKNVDASERLSASGGAGGNETRRATCAAFLERRNPDVAVSGFADGTLRASCVALGDGAPLEFAQKCGGRVRALAALDGAFEMEGEDARALAVSVDELRRSSAGARGVLLAARVPRALPEAVERGGSDDEDDDAATRRRTKAKARSLPVEFGGWRATRDAMTALRAGENDHFFAARLLAGTAGGGVEAFDLGSGQPRCVASFVGPCACPVGDVATCGAGSRLVVATYEHEARGTGHARGCVAFDGGAGGRVAAVDLPRRYGTLGRAGSGTRPGDGPGHGGSRERACALHADANKVVLGSSDGFAHVVDPRTWKEVSRLDVAGLDATAPRGRVSLLRARGERVAAHVDAPRDCGRLVTFRVGGARR